MYNKAMQPSGMFSLSLKHWDAHNFNKRHLLSCFFAMFKNPVVFNGKKPAAPFSPRRHNSASFFRLKRAWTHKGQDPMGESSKTHVITGRSGEN